MNNESKHSIVFTSMFKKDLKSDNIKYVDENGLPTLEH